MTTLIACFSVNETVYAMHVTRHDTISQTQMLIPRIPDPHASHVEHNEKETEKKQKKQRSRITIDRDMDSEKEKETKETHTQRRTPPQPRHKPERDKLVLILCEPTSEVPRYSRQFASCRVVFQKRVVCDRVTSIERSGI